MRNTPPTWWSLDAEKINGLQQDSMISLVKRAKASHFVDVHVRINGQWEIYQADWLKHLTPMPRPAMTTWRSFTYALGRRVARLKAMTQSRPKSPDVFGAAASGSMEMAGNARAVPDSREKQAASVLGGEQGFSLHSEKEHP